MLNTIAIFDIYITIFEDLYTPQGQHGLILLYKINVKINQGTHPQVTYAVHFLQLRTPLTMNSLNFCKRFFTCPSCASDIYYIERFMALFRPMLQFCVKLGRRLNSDSGGAHRVLDNRNRNFFLHKQLAFLGTTSSLF